MNDLKKKFTSENKHKDSSCFLLLIISHGTADNFIQCSEGTKTWNIECLVTEVTKFQNSLKYIFSCESNSSIYCHL